MASVPPGDDECPSSSDSCSSQMSELAEKSSFSDDSMLSIDIGDVEENDTTFVSQLPQVFLEPSDAVDTDDKDAIESEAVYEDSDENILAASTAASVPSSDAEFTKDADLETITKYSDSEASADDFVLNLKIGSAASPSSKPKATAKGKTKKPKKLKASFSSRWSPAEDAILQNGIERFGYGDWKNISPLFEGSRTILQIKNRAQHIRDYGHISKALFETITAAYQKKYPPLLPSAEAAAATTEASANGAGEFAGAYHTAASIAAFEIMKTIPSLLEGDAPITELQLTYPEIAYLNDDVETEERVENDEFFRGSKVKTPQKYVKIRNGIMILWFISKPTYLTQKTCRIVFKNEGDVGAIGRVHSFLERKNKINTLNTDRHAECAPLGERLKRVSRPPRNSFSSSTSPSPVAKRSSIKAKTVTKKKDCKWTVDDADVSADNEDDLHLLTSDQFCLISPVDATSEKKMPFAVEFGAFCRVMIDFHAHLMHTEIIGLLGGTWDAEKGLLTVCAAFPCRSVSSGIECEMDPLSELEAFQFFSEKSLRIVGWYHSHPIFEPNPSIRDIENQWTYQQLLNEKEFFPFIGVIVSPYDKNSVDAFVSTFRFIHISADFDDSLEYRIPVNCRMAQAATAEETAAEPPFSATQQAAFMPLFERCTQEGSRDAVRLNAAHFVPETTRLQKMHRSLLSHVRHEENRRFVDTLISGVEQRISSLSVT